MPTSRLEAFSDGVLAIIITILVLEPWLAVATVVLAALLWLVPDRCLERYVATESRDIEAG